MLLAVELGFSMYVLLPGLRSDLNQTQTEISASKTTEKKNLYEEISISGFFLKYI